jgi:poly(ADP-ribose) glycohydrolase ARH3
MTEPTDLTARFLGSMVGSALGDAIGEMAFRQPDEEGLHTWIAGADELVYTDDTAMAIGLAQSLTALGRLDPQHLGDTFRANFQREPWRGYAQGPPALFRQVSAYGIPYAKAARRLFGGQGSYGNGAAMRITPLGLFYHHAADLYEQAERSATVTHAHPLGVDGAAVLARAIAQAIELDPDQPLPSERFIEGLVAFARTTKMRDKLEMVRSLLAQDSPARVAAPRLGQKVTAQESVPFALYAFLRHPRSFEACLFCAILNGGDRDTLGAMACAISGAYLGIGAVPSDWRARLEHRDEIEALARQLAAIVQDQPDPADIPNQE